jgi:hypothetical protein
MQHKGSRLPPEEMAWPSLVDSPLVNASTRSSPMKWRWLMQHKGSRLPPEEMAWPSLVGDLNSKTRR